jgi:hypothetical protein
MVLIIELPSVCCLPGQEVGLKVEVELGGQLRVSESLSKLEKDRIRAENSKLAKDFQRLKGKFEAGVKAAAARIRELEQARGTGVDGRQGGAVLSPQEAERLQLQLAQDDIDERILQEREEEIMAINQSVVKVRLLPAKTGILYGAVGGWSSLKTNGHGWYCPHASQVNEIFRDLGELVNKQQEDIDRIEDNVQHSHAAAKSGLEQVEKAAKYQPGCLLS